MTERAELNMHSGIGERRVAVFGAGGATGRVLVAQALDVGHRVAAVVRRPDAFELRHERLEVVAADVLDPAAVDAAVAGRDAVLSTLGVNAGRQPISTYSRGTANIVAAMRRHGVRRVVVVSSSGVDPRPYSGAGFVFNRVLVPLLTRVVGRTLYDDMRRMEELLRAADVDWTVVRPSGLFQLPKPSAYTLVEGFADGMYTAREDLAASMLALLEDDRHVRAVVSVVTTEANPALLHWIRTEAMARR